MAVVAGEGLRERLLAVAGELLDEAGVEGASLRAIARRAGVSHGAPLRHFPSLANLLAWVAAGGFRDLHAAVASAAAGAGSAATGRARLAAAGRGYVAFALANPGPFRLMFRFDLLDRSEVELVSASHAAFDQLVELVEAAQLEGWRSGDDGRLLAGAIWSAVHGLASLWLDEAIQPPTGAERVEEILEPLLPTLVSPQGGC